MVDQGVARNQNQQRQADADEASRQADDKGLGVEYLGNISFGRANGPENSDLLLPLQHADIGDNADHDGGYHQRDRHKGDQHIADDVDDIRHRGHQGAYHIGVGNDLILLPLRLHAAVVAA